VTASFARIAAGYLCAVTAAALVYALWYVLPGAGFAPGPFLEVAATLWGFAFLLAAIPFAAGVLVERRLHAPGALFYLGGALLTACGVGLPLIYVLGAGAFDDRAPSAAGRLHEDLPPFALAGLAAGLVYWLVRRRGRAPRSAGGR
jgi:hypothetical protein